MGIKEFISKLKEYAANYDGRYDQRKKDKIYGYDDPEDIDNELHKISS